MDSWWKCFGDHIVKAVFMHNLLNAPCIFCGYNGDGYYQSGTHSKDCPWHNVGGDSERYGALPGVITALFKERQKHIHQQTNGARAKATLPPDCCDCIFGLCCDLGQPLADGSCFERRR